MYKHFFLVTLCAVPLFTTLLGQYREPLVLSYKEGSLKTKNTPFKKVQIVDNRFDSTDLCVYRNGGFPIRYVTVGATAIENYLEEAMKELVQGDKKMLIALNQLRVANKPSIIRRGKRYANIMHDARHYLVMAADIYSIEPDGEYKKLVAVNREYYTFGDLRVTVRKALNNLLEAAGGVAPANRTKEIRKAGGDFHYLPDSIGFLWKDIAVNVREKWGLYPILKISGQPNGRYQNFDDFRDNKLTPGNDTLTFMEKDSAWHLPAVIRGRRADRYPWAISYNGERFIQLYDNVYLKAVQQGNTFWFRIPYSFPDMYSLLCLEDISQTGRGNSAVTTGNLIGDMAGTVLSGAVDASNISDERKKVNKNAGEHDFRGCFIDMDTGDFMY